MAAFPFDAVLFDCDGVLVDSEPITNRVIAEMLGELGWRITVEESMKFFMGKALKDELPLIEERTGATLTADWMAQFRQRRNEALKRELVEIRGAPAAVRALHEALGGRVAVASGADRRKVELQLGKIGIARFFEGRIFSGQELPRSKPHPDVYLKAAEVLGVDPRRCAVVEDTLTGASAGLAAGATVFAYSRLSEDGADGAESAQLLRDAGVAHVFSDMEQLPSLLAGWRAASR